MKSELTTQRVDQLMVHSAGNDRLRFYLEEIFPKLEANTQRAYIKEMNDYVDFCNAYQLPAGTDDPKLNYNTIKLYVEKLAAGPLSNETIKRNLAVISVMFGIAELPNPLKDDALMKKFVNATLKDKRIDGVKQAPALTAELLAYINEHFEIKTLLDMRDIAMINVMYDTLLRGSEFVRIKVHHIRYDHNDLLVPETKTNKSGVPEYRFLSKVSLDLVSGWLSESEIKEGYAFRSMSPKGTSVKDYDQRKSPTLATSTIYRAFGRISSSLELGVRLTTHSPRVGGAVSIYENGGDELGAMMAGGWRSPVMPARYMAQNKARYGAMANVARKKGRL